MQTNLIDAELEKHFNNNSPVYLTLRDNTILKGAVKDYDAYVVILAGDKDSVVYRHSILKVADSPVHRPVYKNEARPAPVPRPAASRSEAQTRPQGDRPPRPKKPPVRPAPARAPEIAPEAQAPMNPLADEMMKWLKSQKGGG
jgi:sRNA-binding regulator protein Hfq